MSSPHLEASEIGGELKAVHDYVQDCVRRVHRGEIMDLQGLDRKVIVLCESIAALPQPVAMRFELQMSQLIAGLEILAETMKEQQKIAMGGGG